MSAKISVLLPTFNNAEIIRPTLESIRWVDEILVVDSFSTDSTVDICREYGARVVQHEYIQSAKQKNWAIPQCANEWVLQIDSDEVLEPGLQEEIEATLMGFGYRSSITFSVNGYRCAGCIPNTIGVCSGVTQVASKTRKCTPT